MLTKRYAFWNFALVFVLFTLACSPCGAIGRLLPTPAAAPEQEPVVQETVPPEASAEVPPDAAGIGEAPEEPMLYLATPTADPATELAPVATLDEVKLATIQIVQEGVSVDINNLTAGQQQGIGFGSGFIIDPAGIAVTNNHVVAGEGRIKVRFGGEDEWIRATVLGVSECSDLAVIDLEGDGYSYLAWHQGDITPPLPVFTAGFPLGDPEFTMTSGIVSKAQANGQSAWASVDRVIEHDATINPGNSGGPLVNEKGQVVAVNYASNPDANQYFAIPRDEALEVIEQLREGHDVDTLGINGQAFKTKLKDGNFLSGIFVSSVKSGSLADKAGLRGGDVILETEGLTLGTDGTMASYCDILRGRSNEEATLSIKALRTQTDPYSCWTGQINGRELEPCNESPSETPEPKAFLGIVTTDKLNLRKGPGTGYGSVGNLRAGEEVVLLRRTQAADWLVVDTVDGRTGGWVASQFIKVVGGAEIHDLPVDPKPTLDPTPGSGCGGGEGSFKLWGSPVHCSLAAGQDKWYLFNSGQDKEATLIAFMRNAEQVDLFLYNGNDLPNGPANPLPPNMGAGTEEGNRDGDSNTREFIWRGPITPDTRYYVRFVNRGNKPFQFCFVSRPDGVCKP